jgi:hypothetical protein
MSPKHEKLLGLARLAVDPAAAEGEARNAAMALARLVAGGALVDDGARGEPDPVDDPFMRMRDAFLDARERYLDERERDLERRERDLRAKPRRTERAYVDDWDGVPEPPGTT